MAVCPYSPLGGGLLTGKYAAGETGRLTEDPMYVGLTDIAIRVNGHQLRIGAFGHLLGDKLGVAVARVKNNNGLCHEKTPWLKNQMKSTSLRTQ